MGYTHYWRIDTPIHPARWVLLTQDVQKIIDASDVDLEFSIEEHAFYINGVGDDSHETALVERSGTEFAFCKTDRNPYDEVVVAVLLLMDHYELARVYSDGYIFDPEEEDAKPAMALLAKAGFTLNEKLGGD